MHLFPNRMRQNHEKSVEQFLEKKGCRAEITTELIFFDLLESSSA